MCRDFLTVKDRRLGIHLGGRHRLGVTRSEFDFRATIVNIHDACQSPRLRGEFYPYFTCRPPMFGYQTTSLGELQRDRQRLQITRTQTGLELSALGGPTNKNGILGMRHHHFAGPRIQTQ